MIRYIIFAISMFLMVESHAQTYSEHYYTRKALFESKADTENEIIFLGNSITEGGDWAALFPNKNAINRGISGDVTDGILYRLEEVTSSQPKKIFLLIGTNDLARNRSVTYIIDNCRKIIQRILSDSENTNIYIQSVLPVNPNVGNKFSGHKSNQKKILAVNVNLKALAKEFNAVYINLHGPFSNSKGEMKAKYTYDGLHLSEQGYKKWKRVISKYVEKNQKVVSFEQKNEMNKLFKNGDNGYACFRIPAVVVTNNGSILAFSEARKKGCSDTGDIDLVMKRSTDNGKTWSNLKVVWNDGENVCGNPVPVVDEETGAIHLLTTWNNGKDHESQIIDGTSIGSREVFQQFSTDDGQSWSDPKNITKYVKLPSWTWYATGPVHGIQLKKGFSKGRLVIPSDHIESKSKKYYSHVIYSDDHGETWEIGGVTPQDQVNECTVAELENGNLLLNMRNYARNESQARQIAISKDGGLSWEDQHIDEELPEPICQGAMLNVERNGKNVLLFTNPADSKSRMNMTMSISRNNGETWREKVSVFNGNSAYSDLAELKNRKIIVLFEAGEKSAYDGIYFKIVSLK